MYIDSNPCRCDISDIRMPSVFMNDSYNETVKIQWFISLSDRWRSIIIDPPNGGVITSIRLLYYKVDSGAKIQKDVTHAAKVYCESNEIRDEGYQHPYHSKQFINNTNAKIFTLTYSLNVLPRTGSAFRPAFLRVDEPNGERKDFDLAEGGIVKYDEKNRTRRTS